MRKLYSLEHVISRRFWKSASVFQHGRVHIVFTDVLPPELKEKLANDTSGLPFRDASPLDNDDGQTKTKVERNHRRRKSIAKQQKQGLRWHLRGFTRKLAASRIQRALRFWRTSLASRPARSSSTVASTGISRADPMPSTSTTPGTCHVSRVSTRASIQEASPRLIRTPPTNRPTRFRDKTKRGVS